MDIVFWIILVVIVIIIIGWLVNRSRSANQRGGSSAGAGTDRVRTDGALEGGSAAASAQAAGTTGIPTAAGFGKPAEPAVLPTAEEPADSAAASSAGTPAGGTSPRSTSPGSTEDGDGRSQDQAQNQAADQAEWETQWSEAGSGSGSSAVGAAGTPAEQPAQAGAPAGAPSGQASPPATRPVHHDEYTAPHAPTLPGAETAALEGTDDGGAAPAQPAGGHAPRHHADTSASPAHQEPAVPPAADGTEGQAAAAETLDRTQSSALVENGADHHQPSGQDQGVPAAGQDVAAAGQGAPPQGGHAQGAQAQGMAAVEPAGHLAADEPCGAGSAAPGPDGSGPADYTVKGDAAAMVYYEEGHPDYEQTRAEVWFESAAHAEAAGFRAPRRKRL